MTAQEPTVELAHSTIDKWGWRLVIVWVLTVGVCFAAGWGASLLWAARFAGAGL